MNASNIFAASILTIFLLLLAGCSPKIKIGEEVPPLFYPSGDNRIIFFQVSSASGRVWEIHPKGTARVTLDDVESIKYGVVPMYWEQSFPLNSEPAPSLKAGEKYQAFAVIFDADVARVNFTIKDGKVAELPKER